MPQPFSNWQPFYEIIGSAAGALTGLQFIVIALIAQARVATSMRDVRAFGSPTVVQFCTALVIAALMTAPWESVWPIGVCLAACGTVGTLYSISILRHARKAKYNPDLEDWIWYAALPMIGNVALIPAAIMMFQNAATIGAFTVAAVTLLFVVIGVRNAWDTVTYVAVKHGGSDRSNSADEKEQGSAAGDVT